MKNRNDIRAALESFSSGVPVVTVKNGADDVMATLATSFHLLAEDPFRVVCSMGGVIDQYPAFQNSKYFAVNLLSSGQRPLLDHLRINPVEHFDGIDCELGLGFTPVLRGCALRIVCRTEYFYPVSDQFVCTGRLQHCESLGLPILGDS